MRADDPLIVFQQSIDIQSVRIVKFPSFIFLCGGQIGEAPSTVASARHYFYLRLADIPALKEKVILAEKLTDWFTNEFYKDLLTLETDIAGLAAVIVIFVESAGSIAELGAFSLIKEINQKLLILIQSRHLDKKSFISLGPINYLRDKIGNEPYAFDWHLTEPDGTCTISTDALDEEFDEILTTLNSKIESIPAEIKFSARETGHILLLISDILGIIYLAKFSELQDALTSIGIKIEDKQLHSLLYLLEKLEFLALKTYRLEKYYVSRNKAGFLKFGYKSDSKIRDKTRWMMHMRAWLESQKGHHRADAYRSFHRYGGIGR